MWTMTTPDSRTHWALPGFQISTLFTETIANIDSPGADPSFVSRASVTLFPDTKAEHRYNESL